MSAAPSNRDLAARFGRAAGAVPATTPEAVVDSESPARLSKFTVQLDRRHAEDFDAVVLGARRALGRRVDKSEVVRVLIRLLIADANLRAEVHQHLAEAPKP